MNVKGHLKSAYFDSCIEFSSRSFFSSYHKLLEFKKRPDKLILKHKSLYSIVLIQMSLKLLVHFGRLFHYRQSFPGGSDGKESACHAGDPSTTLGREDLLEKGMAPHSCLENSMKRGAWRVRAHEVAKRWTQLSF